MEVLTGQDHHKKDNREVALILPQFMLLTFVIMAFMFSSKNIKVYPANITDGTLDIKTTLLSQNLTSLNGRWNFSWRPSKTIPTYDKLRRGKSHSKDLPGHWKQFANKEGLQQGFASYWLEVDFSGTPKHFRENLSIMIKPIAVAYELYLLTPDQPASLLIRNGTFGVSKEKSRVQKVLTVAEITKTIPPKKLILLWNVSNFEHFQTNIQDSPILGENLAILALERNSLFRSFSILGVIFLMAILSLTFHIFSKDNSGLWLSFFCIAFFTNILVVQGFHSYLTPQQTFDFRWNLFLGFFTLTLTAITFAIYSFSTLDSHSRLFKNWLKVNTYMTFVILALYMLIPTGYYVKIFGFAYLHAFSCILSAFFILFRAKEHSTFLRIISSLGFTLLCFTCLNDMLHHLGVIETGYVAVYGIVIFIFFQLQSLAFKVRWSLNKLAYLNTNLTQEIDSHTQQLTLSNKKLEEENLHVNSLTRILCHDIATPLNIVSGGVHILQERLKESKDPVIKRFLGRMENAADLQTSILDHVRNLLAYRSGRMSIELNHVNLIESVSNVVDLLFERFNEKKIVLEWLQRPLEEAIILADKTTLISQVLMNVFTNALKFSFSGNRISLTCIMKDESITLRIRDYGIGMSEEIINQVFEFSGSSSSRQGTSGELGTGFGMPIVKEYMEAFQGGIKVESNEMNENVKDHGTTIILTFKRPSENLSQKVG